MQGIRRQSGKRGEGKAFSVIELMIAVSIMGIIVYVLFMVFNQTQKALRATEIQGDVSEKARSIMEIVSRELGQAHPTFYATPTNGTWIPEVNMYGRPDDPPRVQSAAPTRQDIQSRTNVLHSLFFMNVQSNTWFGIGYRVTNVLHGVGELVRFQRPFINYYGMAYGRPESNILASAFRNEPMGSTNFNHVADGVIHFKVTAYDSQGYQYRYQDWNSTNQHDTNYTIVWRDFGGNVQRSTSTNLPTVFLQEAFPGVPQETSFAFASNAMPAYVELELAMLEPETLRQFYTMVEDENPNATNFLSRQISKVHLFRQRIPIRTAAQ